MSNYTSTDNTATGNMNEKPTVGEKLKAAFSSKTADEIHAENLAKKEQYADNNNMGGSGMGSGAPSTLGNIGMGTTTMDTGARTSNYPSTTTSTSSSSTTMPVIHDDRSSNQNWSSNTTSSALPSSTTHTSSTTHGATHQMPMGGTHTKTETGYTVRSVAEDAYNQIAMQEREALVKAEQLRKQDESRLMNNATTAMSQLDAQAEALKAKVEREKLAAEAEIASQQASKVTHSKERAEMEKAAIHQAALQRRAELEAKANKLQHEIDELTRLKTQEMMMDKPGDLQFQHVREDTGIVAKLTGAVSHKLGLAEKQTVTDSITHGHVEHQPAQITKTYQGSTGAADTQTNTWTQQGQYHELPAKSVTSSTTTTSGQPLTTGRQDLADSKRNL